MMRSLSLFWKTPRLLNGAAPTRLLNSTASNAVASIGVTNAKRIKAGFYQCSPEQKVLFPQSCAQVTISLDQPIHYGAKFHATMNLVKTHFKACKIMVADTVQRHTYAILYPEKSCDELRQLSYDKGNSWIAESINTLSNLTIPCKVIRWDHWLEHPDFPAMLETIKKHYESDDTYRTTVERSVSAYLERFLVRHPEVDPKHAYECCIAYLQEECAGMALWPELGCQFEIYPSGRNGALKATYERFIKPKHPDLLKIVALRFAKSNVTYETEIDPREIVYDDRNEQNLTKNIMVCG